MGRGGWDRQAWSDKPAWSREGESWLRDRDRGRREPSCDSEEESNIEFDLVCDRVPVVGLYESNEFYEHVSSMLQAAVGSTGKADSLYEACGDRRVLSACSDLGLSDHEVQVARLTDPGLRHIKAAGTSGRHSVKLALVVAVVLDGARELGELWRGTATDMRYYHLEEAFGLLTRSARESLDAQRHHELPGGQRPDERAGRPGHGERAGGQRCGERAGGQQVHEEQYDDDGVDLRFVSGPTPVVGLLKSSPLHEHASWLLQIATGGTGKAAALYEYVDRGDDAGILGECHRRSEERRRGAGSH
ncbi:unnamed protein product [Prorocentrum cordatum]|uniref:Uncharacterized protein n=1 Tax=Prorocentrum cordatum TaxID=2364126 RepID=A0ABN9XNB0_9DINO|nr:unnamed protein product [Polarella glacialis]